MDATEDVSNDDGIAMDVAVVGDATTDAPVVVDSGVVIDARAGDAGRRSVFFPAAWQPQHAGGTPDSMGRILPDFAYSGYHQNVEPPPCGARPVVATVDRALGDGMANATAAIQAAINTACMAPGGGAVRIPAGTYRITFPAASPSTAPALSINCSNVVLRGEGPTTRLWLDDPRNARNRPMLLLSGGGSLYDTASTTTFALTANAPTPTRTLSISATATLSVGDWIGIHQDNTAAFRADHDMSAYWPDTGFQGLVYLRRVTSFAGGRLGLDAPTPYPLATRDRARVYRVTAHISEVGVESLAIGMTSNTQTTVREPDDDEAYDGPAGTTPYEVHNASAINFGRVHNGWVCDVASFRPTRNSANVHVLSKGIVVSPHAARLTIARTTLGYPLYRGGGGNGYLFEIDGSDVLVRDSESTNARHGFVINNAASGVVFLRDTIRTSRLADDSHRFLAHANLYDNVALDSAWLQSVNRGSTSTGAGYTGTQHVFWNTRVTRNHPTARGVAIESAQFGHGYLLGSIAAAGQTATLRPQSFTNSGWAALPGQGAPTDTVESQGALLDPPSLYEAQRALRCMREGLSCR